MSKKQVMILESIGRTGMLTHIRYEFNMSDKVSSILTHFLGVEWKNYRLARGVACIRPRRKPEKLKWVTLSHPHEDPNVAELFHDISLDSRNPQEKYYLVLSKLDVNLRHEPTYKPYIEHAIYWLQGLYMYPHQKAPHATLEFEPILSREQSINTNSNLQNVNYRMGVDRNRPISAYIQVVKVDLSPSDKCYQFNNAYTRHHKNIVYEEEVVSGTRSLFSVIDQLFRHEYHYDDERATCVEILLFHNNYEQPDQLWQFGQRRNMLSDNAPYLLRDNWEWTPDLFGLTDGDRIEIRIAPLDDMNSFANDYFYNDYERYHSGGARHRNTNDANDYGDDDYERYHSGGARHRNTNDAPANDETMGRRVRRSHLTRRRERNQLTQPRSSLYNVLSQLETINISSTLGARGDPPPSRDSQERERHLEEEIERARRRLAQLLRQNHMKEMELQEMRKSNRSSLQDNF
jgi:hypothetical protein